MRAALLVLALSATAHADGALHGSAGGGGALLLSGAQGDRLRLDVAVDVKLRSRFGVLLAARALDVERAGLVMAGVTYEGAAARPRLVLDLFAAAGVDVAARAPLVGGGLRTTLAIYQMLGVVLDLGGYLVIDGLADTRLQIQSSTLLVVRW